MNTFEYFSSSTGAIRSDGFCIVIPKQVTSKEQLMEVYSKEAHLPNYFGSNWDALDEALRDFSWIKEKSISIVHEDLPNIGSSDLKIYLGLLFEAIGDWKAGDSHHLHVLFPERERETISASLSR